jgi:hypothetical protein
MIAANLSPERTPTMVSYECPAQRTRDMLQWQKLPYGKRGEFADHGTTRYVVRKLNRQKRWELLQNGQAGAGTFESADAAKQAAQSLTRDT